MSIVTIMLGVILGLVFYFTRANLETESIAMMQNIASQPFHPGIPNESGGEVRLPYFILQVSPRGELIATSGGYYDLSNDAFLSDLIDMAFASPKAFGVIEGYHLRYYRVGTPIDQCLVFTDISSEVATLDHLTKTCLFLGGLGFGVFLAISILLSGWAVKPVEIAWQRQRQFVADASHELKTPLTVILSNADMLEKDRDIPEGKNRQRISHIKAESLRMKQLIESLLALARSDSGQESAVCAPVDLSFIVNSSLMAFEPLAFDMGKHITYDIEAALHVNGDDKKLRQLTDILLDNACKYSQDNGSICVTLKKTSAKEALLTVSDEGAPLTKEEIKHLFLRFYRGDTARSNIPGYGLGLSIAQSIVSEHGGKIEASTDGFATNSFIVRLPIQE